MNRNMYFSAGSGTGVGEGAGDGVAITIGLAEATESSTDGAPEEHPDTAASDSATIRTIDQTDLRNANIVHSSMIFRRIQLDVEARKW